MKTKPELIGASGTALRLHGTGAGTAVKLDPAMRGKVTASLAAASEKAAPDRVFLNLENVRGLQDAAAVSVYVGLPEDADPLEHPEHKAGAVGLFGLRKASLPTEEHGGQGLTFVVDITDIIDSLHLRGKFDAKALNVRLVPSRPIPEQAQVSIGRISVYRQGQA
jgi:tyrosinase